MAVVPEFVFELGTIIVIAATLAVIIKSMKQPPIIAYILTGIISGPLVLNLFKSNELVNLFATLGITFLLFIVGLSLNFKSLKKTGKAALTVGVTQVVITSLIGFLVSLLIGFSYTPAFYVAAALAISSTVIVMNILSEKRETETLHGKISIGILIVQDFIAALILVIIPFINNTFSSIIENIGIGIGLIFGIFLISRYLLPSLFKIAAKSQEVLFLVSIAWAVGVAALFNFFHFPIELGALIAGMSLSSSKFSFEISGKIKGLREFFVIIHLIFFGSLLTGPITWNMIGNAGIFSLIVLIGNPLIVMTIMKRFHHKKRTNFLTGINIAQLSELSLIIAFLGFAAGAITQGTFSLIILTTLITITISTYAIEHGKKLYQKISHLLKSFEEPRKTNHEKNKAKNLRKYDVILFGYNRIGFNLLKGLRKANKKFLVIDYNPDTIDLLEKNDVPVIYGDANDPEFLEDLKLTEAKSIISTIPDLETNLTIAEHIKRKNIVFIPTSHSIEDTRGLYKAGADYVIMPHFLGGEHVSHLVTDKNLNKNSLKRESKRQKKELTERTFEGHTHPNRESYGK
ncbi:MAG TPA: cation:proton antiporter [Candidatus Nanoarchaeia archaeon]|nr:cation:proton antiporter [Candidatus Nanoarchaeia archaeon]